MNKTNSGSKALQKKVFFKPQSFIQQFSLAACLSLSVLVFDASAQNASTNAPEQTNKVTRVAKPITQPTPKSVAKTTTLQNNPIKPQVKPPVRPQVQPKVITNQTASPTAQVKAQPSVQPKPQPIPSQVTEEPASDIWTNVNVNDPKLSIKRNNQINSAENTQSVRRPNGSTVKLNSNRQLIENSGQIKPKSPTLLIQELKDPNAQEQKKSLLNSGEDPAGQDLEKRLPLDEPMTSRLSKEVLDPIQLDVDQDQVLDLNIQKAILIALESNLPQRIIDETVTRDKWRFWTTGSGLLPDGFYAYSLNDQSLASTASGSGTTHISRLGMRYNLGPSEIFGTMAAYYDWIANSSFQGASLQDLMRRTLNQYYEVMRARGELAVRIEAVKQAKIQLSLNEKLDQAGVGTRFAVLQAREQMAENELALLAQQSSSRIAEIQLLTTLNLPLGTDIRLEETELEKSTLVSPEYTSTDLVELALSNRPDIRRRQLSKKAARNRVRQTVSNAFLPVLTSQAFMFGQTVQPGSIGRSAGDAFRLNESQFSLGLELPILTGLGLGQIAPINESRAVSRQAGYELENEILNVESEVRDAFLRSQAADKRINVAEKQLNAATEGIKLARIRLANGVGTNIDLIDTQRNYVNALVNKVRAIVEYNQSQTDMLRSIGLISVQSITDKDYAYRSSVDGAAILEDEVDDDFEDAGYGADV